MLTNLYTDLVTVSIIATQPSNWLASCHLTYLAPVMHCGYLLHTGSHVELLASDKHTWLDVK